MIEKDLHFSKLERTLTGEHNLIEHIFVLNKSILGLAVSVCTCFVYCNHDILAVIMCVQVVCVSCIRHTRASVGPLQPGTAVSSMALCLWQETHSFPGTSSDCGSGGGPGQSGRL